MLADTFPPEKRGAAIAAYGVVVIVGPIFGPTLGGWITDTYSWHWVFLINVPFGLLSLFLVRSSWMSRKRCAAAPRDAHRRSRIDYIGFALVALFLGCLELTLDRGQREDWFASPMITGLALTSACAFTV